MLDAGDTINVTVCSNVLGQTTNATANFYNLSTNSGTSWPMDNEGLLTKDGKSTAWQGISAQWITEDPYNGPDTHYKFPNYGQVVYTDCEVNGVPVDLTLATTFDLVQDGVTTSACTVLGTNAVPISGHDNIGHT